MRDGLSRTSAAAALVGLVCLSTPALAEVPTTGDLEALRKTWHGCVRDAFSAQPAALDRKIAQRAALAQCKASEDAYVAAELSVQQAAEEARRKGSLSTRARAWMASVASYVVDPVASWIGGGH